MTVPANFFGGNSDGAMRMEDWLAEMCKGCRHGRSEDWGGDEPMRGMGCDLPAQAYAEPHSDLTEWSRDADPSGPMGLMCMKKQTRRKYPRGKPKNQQRLFEVSR